MDALKDSVPPHNLDAEQAVLGALLLDWGARSDEGVFSRLEGDHFYSQQNRLIYEALRSLDSKSITCDTISLTNELKKNDNLEKVGGISYIASLTNTVPTSANIKYYADLVFDCAMRRALIKACAVMKASAFDESKNSAAILDEAEQYLFDLSDKNNTSKIYGMKEAFQEAIEQLQAMQNKDVDGVRTGFADLDNVIPAFRPQQLIIIGARPSMGKTALALSLIENIAIKGKEACGFISLEMPRSSIMARLISQVSGVDGKKIRTGQFISLADMAKIMGGNGIAGAADSIYEAPLYIIDTPNMRLSDLRTMARRMVVNYNVKIIFIDYIGLITLDDARMQAWEKVSEISRSLKSLARELNIPIVALSQLAREAEKEKPTLAQIRGSGSIEQDADVVLLITGNRHDGNTEDGQELPVVERTILIEKQRDGPTGAVKLAFRKACTRFENLAKESF